MPGEVDPLLIGVLQSVMGFTDTLRDAGAAGDITVRLGPRRRASAVGDHRGRQQSGSGGVVADRLRKPGVNSLKVAQMVFEWPRADAARQRPEASRLFSRGRSGFPPPETTTAATRHAITVSRKRRRRRDKRLRLKEPPGFPGGLSCGGLVPVSPSGSAHGYARRAFVARTRGAAAAARQILRLALGLRLVVAIARRNAVGLVVLIVLNVLIVAQVAVADVGFIVPHVVAAMVVTPPVVAAVVPVIPVVEPGTVAIVRSQ